MADPIGGLGQASAKMIEEIQKQAQQQVQAQQDTQGVNKFSEVMSSQQVQGVQGSQQVQATQQVDGTRHVDGANRAVETLQAAKLHTRCTCGVRATKNSSLRPLSADQVVSEVRF